MKAKLPDRVSEMRHPRWNLRRGQKGNGRRVVLGEQVAAFSQLSMQPLTGLRPPVATAYWLR